MRRTIVTTAIALGLGLSSCFAEQGESPVTIPIGGGDDGQSFTDWWQGKTPSDPPLGATGLAKSQASPSPSPTEPAPAETQSAEVPQAVPPPPLETIEGVQEVYYRK